MKTGAVPIIKAIKRLVDGARIYLRAPKYLEQRSVQRQRRASEGKMVSSENRESKQLLVDVSVISKHNAGTGIQRVVGAIFIELATSPPKGFVICPVSATRKKSYQYIEWGGCSGIVGTSEEVTVRAGDIFLALDFSTHAIARHQTQLSNWKQAGVRFHFIVHDLLPEHHPEWFSPSSVLSYRQWIKQVAILADEIVCNSQDTKDQLLSHLERRFGFTPGLVETRVIPMGWDIHSAIFSEGLPPDFASILNRISAHTTALIVGTIEPRKGHAQLVDAFDHLWGEGKCYNLVIVGRLGWKTDELQKRLRQHSQFGKLLIWLDDASDEALERLYQACDGVVIASLAEGYGLPLIEALGYKKPVLARDLAVFHEIESYGVEYFSADDPKTLAAILSNWLERCAEIKAGLARPEGITWRETYLSLISSFHTEQ